MTTVTQTHATITEHVYKSHTHLDTDADVKAPVSSAKNAQDVSVFTEYYSNFYKKSILACPKPGAKVADVFPYECIVI